MFRRWRLARRGAIYQTLLTVEQGTDSGGECGRQLIHLAGHTYRLYTDLGDTAAAFIAYQLTGSNMATQHIIHCLTADRSVRLLHA